ncbi:hypothetical protein GCM10022419_101290 [Nonomuraea rosea]|uniref:Uncharacterized protein n=1 Tax=Nonomuraea rosea TaxID=638574 RepID=A0ABP6ZAK5_9ACTN
MTNDLTDARSRLIPSRQLRQVAALLNMPHLDETATHNDDNPQPRQQAALYAGIADWARLSAQAAEQLGEPDPLETARFAYLVEYTDRHSKGWHPAPSEHSDGIILAGTAETVAQSVVTRYITHLTEHRDDYELWIVDSLSLRASVWHVDTAVARFRGHRPDYSSSARMFKEAEILPDAVEIRTPIQIHRLMGHHIAL